MFLHAHSKDSDQTGLDAQVDLSLHWACMSFCWFCCMQAQMILSSLIVVT